MRTQLLQLGRGRRILGVDGLQSLPDEAAVRALHPDMAVIYEVTEFGCSTRRDALDLTPSLDDVLYILECAADYLRMGRSEAAWNTRSTSRCCVLHFGLASRIPFSNWLNSTASIVLEYLNRFAYGATIDFCIYLDPHCDPIDKNIVSKVDSVRARLLLLSTNPTDDLSLLNNPIAIATETKRPGEDSDAAHLQVTKFLTAYLTLLQCLVADGTMVPVGEGEKAPSVGGLGVFHGLIVQGNIRNFIAASRQDSRVVLWSGTSTGLIGDISGIY
ncbi:hypothetical protein ACHAPU_002749 [Fusarium lateritium]